MFSQLFSHGQFGKNGHSGWLWCAVFAVLSALLVLAVFHDPGRAGFAYIGWGLFGVSALLMVGIGENLRRAIRRATEAEQALCGDHCKKTSVILENISDGFAVLDRNWRIVCMNSAAARLVRLPREVLIGKVIWEVLPETGHLLFGKEYRRAMAEHVAIKVEDFYPEPLNAWFEVRGYPSAEGLTLFFSDITERKATNQRFRQLSRAVHQSPSSIVITDTAGMIEYVNPKFTELTGYTMEEAVGKNPSLLKSGELAPKVYQELWETITSGSEWRGEFHNKKKNGDLYWEFASISPIYDDHGSITHFLAIKEDITERKRTEAALLEAKRSAEDANSAKDDFIATLSHELRTPLNPVLMTASVLELDETLTADLRSQISLIRHNVELEARLIDDLLDVTKITHGKFSIQRECVHVGEILRRAVEIVREEFVRKAITVDVDASAEMIRVNADPTRLQQVFWNLLKNAVKFTPAGGAIRVRAFNPDPQTLAVEVSDTGIGISPELIDDIFLPFHQGAATGKHRYGGLGLGLAISQKIVDAHGGTLTAASSGFRCGSTFTVQLPVWQAEKISEFHPPVAMKSVLPQRILLVEDHEHTRAVLLRLLLREGHRVEAVDSCAAAMAAAHRQPTTEPFQTLISDLGLPDCSGLVLVQKLKAEMPNLTAIAISGYGTEDDVLKSLEAGFAKHLTKPINFQDLRRMLAA